LISEDLTLWRSSPYAKTIQRDAKLGLENLKHREEEMVMVMVNGNGE